MFIKVKQFIIRKQMIGSKLNKLPTRLPTNKKKKKKKVLVSDKASEE